MKRTPSVMVVLVVLSMLSALAYVAGWVNGQAGLSLNPVREAQAAGGKIKDPTGTAPNRYVYYPGTEALAEDEIRVICCGS